LYRQIININCPNKIANKELWSKTDENPTFYQLRRRKWDWRGYMLRRNYDSIAKQAASTTVNKHYSRHRRDTAREGNQRTRGKEIRRKK